MSDKQRVLFSQLQLAGLGIVVAVIGGLNARMPLVYVGAGLFVFGLVRFALLKKVLSQTDENE